MTIREIFERLLRVALSAESYWREAVKNLPETDGDDNDGMGLPSCLFCSASGWENLKHEADCPWLLAQDPT